MTWIPRRFSASVSQRELVSCRYGVRSSEPTAIISAFIYKCFTRCRGAAQVAPKRMPKLVLDPPEKREAGPTLVNVRPGVGDHVRTQISPPGGERTIQHAQDGDDHDLLPALVGVCQSKHRPLQNHCGDDAARCRPELVL